MRFNFAKNEYVHTPELDHGSPILGQNGVYLYPQSSWKFWNNHCLKFIEILLNHFLRVEVHKSSTSPTLQFLDEDRFKEAQRDLSTVLVL